MASKFTKKDLQRLFHNTARVMGWNPVWFDAEGKVASNAVRLDYYALGGGYQIVRATNAEGGEGHLLFRDRKSLKEMKIALETMAWTRGYVESEFNLPKPELPHFIDGVYQRSQGDSDRKAYMRTALG